MYVGLFVVFASAVAWRVPTLLYGSPVLVGALLAMSVCGYVGSQTIWSRVSALLDVTIALALVALVFAGPIVAFAVAAAPDVLRLVRRRRAFLNAGLLANLVSYLAEILAGSAVLALAPTSDPIARGFVLLGMGIAMAIANYTFARLLFASIVHRERASTLLRREFVPQLPLELAVILAGVISVLLIPTLEIPTLLLFSFAAYVPQLSAGALLRAPSVAKLSVDSAAGVYRAALGDELALGSSDRHDVEHVDSLIQRGIVHKPVPHLHRVLTDAVIANTCLNHRPTQPAWKAPIGAQVVLVARAWAQLTANGTPALNHAEALHELTNSDLLADAPDALTATARIIDREQSLTEAVAGVPRLHRLPLPRRARLDLVPRALTHLIS